MTPPTHNTAPQTEAQLQRAAEDLLDLLVLRGQVVIWYHRPDHKPDRRERGGFLDICIGLPGDRLPVAVELKRDNAAAKPTKDQLKWLACWHDRGAVVRTVEQFRAALRGWGVDV